MHHLEMGAGVSYFLRFWGRWGLAALSLRWIGQWSGLDGPWFVHLSTHLLMLASGADMWRHRLLFRSGRFAAGEISIHSLFRRIRNHRTALWLGWGGPWDAIRLQRHWDASMGEPHQLSPVREDRPVWLDNQGRGHMIVLGAPGTGKTQAFLLMALQALARGDTVLVLDPKGGETFPRCLQSAALQRHRVYLEIDAHHPHQGGCLDVLAAGRDPSELASRLCQLLPLAERATVFGQFAWMTLFRIIAALRGLNESLTFSSLRFHVGDQGRQLVRTCWQRWGREHTLSVGMDHLARHDAVHYSKMIVSLLPLLEILATGVLGTLLGSDSGRKRFTLKELIEQRAVVYVSLGALSNARVAQMLGTLVLGELAALAGDRYRASTVQRSAVRIFVDEAAELSGETFVQLLNKGRECDMQVTLAVQTLTDLEVAMGGMAPARMMVGNAAHLLVFRTLDAESCRTLNDRAGRVQIQKRQAGTTAPAPRYWWQGQPRAGAMLQRQWQEVPLIPEGWLTRLEDLHYLGFFSGQGVIWGCLPRLRVPGEVK
ncbi:MAG: type IV secretion system DNA-binding domain-containing protein [Ferrovum myxofaciens]|uniref:type IV secretion system DNA-binding domain-containing protein n=1 Tax=Ferrovum myxofaciens TaxID=416213 RepID=UPI0023539FF9|nr:type IV secretion system DNA-binding domain-containing protein [Ferrovum myxofaciens]QKE41865.1 MAG: type IV secretion system DNA-binding domain-containing protein [Ferrovum myxofaciens]